MTTAQARAVTESTGLKVDFAEWDKLWKDNPCVSKQGGIHVRNRTGDRPYILCQTDKVAVFSPNFKAMPGEIYLTNNEIKDAKNIIGKAKDFVLVQPEVKLLFSKGNKAWPRPYWNKLVERLQRKGHTVLQMIPNKSETEKALKGTKIIVAETFRTAIAVVMQAKLLVCCDGGLHHAAAAKLMTTEGEVISTGTPAAVIWTGFSHPKHLGYDIHKNIRYDDSEPCGMKVACQHCRDMSEKVTPQMVDEQIRDYLGNLPTNLR